jgi:hypothetical protein
MQIDLAGKIREKRLAFNNTLLPLFEAVVNSIQAIEDGSATKPGLITIELIRIPQENLNFQEVSLLGKAPIMDFIVRDNGIGFTEENFESFSYAHSTYKERRGGKGIGRIIWLRAFTSVEIESLYPDKEGFARRKFQFLPTREGVENHQIEKVDGSKHKRFTEVRLKGLKADYQRWCNTDVEDIALKVIEHCFIYFLQEDCPRISLIDGENEIFVNDLFRIYTKDNVKSRKLNLKRLNFEVKLVKLYSRRPDNKIHYCADTREVQQEKLSQEIPELDTTYTDIDNEKFTIAVYVTGEYLNRNVNEERTEISFIKHNDVNFQDEITLDELREGVGKIVRTEFGELISELSADKDSRMRQFISEHPRYRQLLRYKPNEVRKISTNLSSERLELELFKLFQQLELEVKREADELLKGIDKIESQEDFKSRYNLHYKKIIDVGNSKLSEYILYRKVVLEILEKQLSKGEDGKFATEAAIHKLVFPLRKESDDIGYDQHNLWIIDERLAFHKYLASDKPFKTVKDLSSNSEERPDLLVFNRPFAFSENDKPYGSIVLVEFKRPMRDDYDDEENPITQVNRYARQIIEASVNDKNGRPFDVRETTPIYAYIICDLTPKLRLFAKDAGYRPLPDNDGFFDYNPNYSMYVEVISFDKLIKDSRHRNKALFEKLNLTSL